MQINLDLLKSSLYVMIKLQKMTDVYYKLLACTVFALIL